VILVVGEFDVDPADRDRFVESRRAQAATAAGEDGCIDYVLSLDAFDPGRVRLFEAWGSQEALAAHTRAIRDGGGPPGDVAVRARRIRIIEGTERSDSHG
jgi:antibiotic biosynthesis monooxygenase